jgi:hypothetical protein
MTNNLYVIKTNGGRYARMRVFAAGGGMVSLEYASHYRR